jgi:hypothetical protein
LKGDGKPPPYKQAKAWDRFHGLWLPVNRRAWVTAMSKLRRITASLPLEDALFHVKPRKAVPFEFVLDGIAALSPYTRPLFGCVAVYVQDKIVLVLRDKRTSTVDNGVWLATTREHHESLRREFPSMRSIKVLGAEVTGWQVLPADEPDFEEAALHACELILAKDPRIGKVPGSRRSPRAAAKRGGRTSKRSNG